MLKLLLPPYINASYCSYEIQTLQIIAELKTDFKGEEKARKKKNFGQFLPFFPSLSFTLSFLSKKNYDNQNQMKKKTKKKILFSQNFIVDVCIVLYTVSRGHYITESFPF